MVGFAECPKLRIHECKLRDIVIFANDRLKCCSSSPTLIYDGDICSLVNDVAGKADTCPSICHFKFATWISAGSKSCVLGTDRCED